MGNAGSSDDFSRRFVEFACGRDVLRFGEFRTKAGRLSPYFFDAGLFDDGESIRRLGEFYTDAIVAAELRFDMLFGPAYKGITLVTATAIAFAARGRAVPFCFNRKEAKDHGEGGTLVGAAPRGRVLIVDDVISAGTSVRESVDLLRQAGAEPCGVVIALDRMERGQGSLSAVEEVRCGFGMPVVSVATLEHVVDYLARREEYGEVLGAVRAYRERYGISSVRE